MSVVEYERTEHSHLHDIIQVKSSNLRRIESVDTETICLQHLSSQRHWNNCVVQCVRFNKTKSRWIVSVPGHNERQLAVRQECRRRSKTPVANKKNANDRSWMVTINYKDATTPDILNACKRHHLFTYNSQKNRDPKNRDLRVFKSCNFCHKNNKCLHRSSLLGPTTGLMGVEFVSTTYPNATIHLLALTGVSI